MIIKKIKRKSLDELRYAKVKFNFAFDIVMKFNLEY